MLAYIGKSKFPFYWWATQSLGLTDVLAYLSSCIWCFGLFKRLYKRTVITSLNDIAQVAERSAQCNHALVVRHLDGTSVVPFYDWSTFFDNNRVIKTALKGISQMHHFRFTADRRGCVILKESSNGTERQINLLKDKSWRPSAADLPETITPPGLSLERMVPL